MNKIDVHHHITPKFYLQELESVGITESFNQAFPKWTPETSFSYMKKFGIDTAIASISTPGDSLYSEDFSRKLAGPANIVFGSDLPFGENVLPMSLKDFNRFDGFYKEDIDAINFKNCLKLFPSLHTN